ncbi:hypothetical protein IFR04_013370 [Cadophora malorum]|uniref:Hemerythrin-like domain-containing protein n=1 Tax=Cadophora malorum TaxID=108018 RepID=A0A8H7T2N8_9HELO|nr:hypothetical protein IFR04_013370 [Cadophora malorum]
MGQTHPKVTRQWADGPFPLIETPRKRRGITNLQTEPGAVSAATEMCLVHNVMIRIMNCIYLQAPNVKLEKDITDFTIFMHSFLVLLHEHHGNEEKFFFPMLEEYIGTPGWMEKNVAQHHAFSRGLEGFEEYVKALQGGKAMYDGTKIRKLVDDFAPVLAEHLTDEIVTFEDLESLGNKIDWKTWNKKVSEIAVKTAETDHEIPIVLTNMDIPFEKPFHQAVWPPFPWFAALMFRWMYLPRHKGAWRFSCCDWYGNPKELEFV